jgi:hypothetical protein
MFRLLSLLLLAGACANAATVKGTVQDPSGAYVQGAAVELRAIPATDSAKTTKTGAAGAFEFPKLAATHYRLRVSQPGFEAFETDVLIENGADAVIAVHLKVTAVKETLDVAGARHQAVDPVYRALRTAEIADSFTVENLILKRDSGVVTLKSGTVSFSAPAMGRDTTAVFSGEGEFTFEPVLGIEKAHMMQVAEMDRVKESFDRAVFHLTDDTGAEIRRQGKPRPADPKFASLLRDFRKGMRARVEQPRSMTEALIASDELDNLDAEALADLLNPKQPGFFSAYLHGRKHSDLRFHVKPRGVIPAISPEEVAVINFDPAGEQDGIWYLAHRMEEFDGGKASSEEDHRVVEAQSYRVETAIGKNDHLAATAEIELRAVSSGDRVIRFGLLPNLRVTRVSAAGQDVPFVQEDRREDGSFYVVMPQAMARGSNVQLLIEYQGDKVVYHAGGGNFSIDARTSWYPSINSFRDHARYRLIFKIPKQYTLAATGKQIREWAEQDFACSEWDSEVPVAVAGFNYGDFKKKSIDDSTLNFRLDGYAVGRMPDSMHDLEQAMGGMNPTRMNERNLVDAQNAMRIFTQWFGKSEFNHIAITQQPEFGFGQSWPMLVYMPLSAYLDSTQRWALTGGINSRLTEFVDEVAAHEVSHQWWGHMVGWSSYHDQWLSEGFAFFSAGLFLQFTEKNQDKYLSYWENARKSLTQKNSYGRRTLDAGPVWMGLRLDSFRNQHAYSSVVYRKGGYILHMLRSMMWTSKDHDKEFMAMLQEFVQENLNGNASTERFCAIAEKHMSPAMDMEGNHRLGWFFRQWIYGTTVPKYKFEPTVTAADNGKWLLKATLTQSEVDDNFVMPVPIYADFDGAIVRLGAARITGNTTNSNIQVLLPKKPRRVMINAVHDILEM